MKVSAALSQAWSRLRERPAYERDPEFREVVLRHSRRGMQVIFFIGVGSVVLYTAAHLLFVGSEMTWIYRPGESTRSVTIWDKLVLIAMSVVCLILGRSSLNGRGGRLAVVAIIIFCAWILLADDLPRASLAGTPSYLLILMLCGVGTMPFRAWQSFLMCSAVTLVFILAAMLYPEAIVGAPAGSIARRAIPLIIATLICAGISELLYRTRWQQYLAFKEAERLTNQVREQSEQLMALERTKARFFANISHEFRTPLTLILGPLEDALQDPALIEDRANRLRLGIIRRGAIRLQRLIDQLLDLSRLEAGRMDLHLRRHELVAFVRTLIVWFEPLAQRAGIDLRMQSHRERFHVPFDADKMEKIISNLISNALKFTPSGGKVVVSISQEQRNGIYMAVVSVRDTGIGIREADVSHIFDRFYQVDGSTRRLQEGTGIGLSLARELVELHGGRIGVESIEGFGSTFTVEIPILRDGQEVAAGAALEPAAPTEKSPLSAELLEPEEDFAALMPEEASPETPLVLIVDDNQDLRLHIRSILGRNYRIAEAENGEQGLEAARKLRPSLVVSDVMMPGVDGFALCQAIRSDPDISNTAVILLTARADEESKLEGLAVRADEYLFKPFSASELEARVENLITIRRMLREALTGTVQLKGTDLTIQSADVVFLEKVRTTIESHMADTNFGVEQLADEVGYHPRQLQRKIRAVTKLSTSGYIRYLRLHRASQYLEARAGTISEIAYRVGYNDANHFSKLFRQMFGMSPTEYVAKRTVDRDVSDMGAAPSPLA